MGDLLTIVTKHLPIGMILQVAGELDCCQKNTFSKWCFNMHPRCHPYVGAPWIQERFHPVVFFEYPLILRILGFQIAPHLIYILGKYIIPGYKLRHQYHRVVWVPFHLLKIDRHIAPVSFNTSDWWPNVEHTLPQDRCWVVLLKVAMLRIHLCIKGLRLFPDIHHTKSHQIGLCWSILSIPTPKNLASSTFLNLFDFYAICSPDHRKHCNSHHGCLPFTATVIGQFEMLHQTDLRPTWKKNSDEKSCGSRFQW